MRNLYLLLASISLILLSYNAFSQPSYGGKPLSFTKNNLSDEVDYIKILPPDMQTIIAEADFLEKNDGMYRVGELVQVNINMENSGTWDYLEDGTKVWRVHINLEQAKGLALYYKDFYLPKHSQLFLYNKNRKQVIGAFDDRNNPKMFPDFSTEIIQGSDVFIEYIQYPQATEEANIDIYEIVYVYRGISQLIGKYEDSTKETGGVGASDPCQVNVNCPEGADWQSQKRGVAEIFVVQGFTAGLCTGSLVNNTANDGTPYFLTADHCGGSASNFNNWQFYFNYEAEGCTNPGAEPAYNTVTGAVKRARGNENTGSDMLLLELNTDQATLASYNAYYNGWYRGTDASPSGVCIHHPSGDIKKISTYTATLTSATWTGGSPSNAWWKAYWVETQTNWGVTEGGSSGSPIFNNNKLIVGTLTGGASGCNVPATSKYDLYGKFDYHWISNGSAPADQLKPWLDPDNTGAIECPGFDPNAAIGEVPVADFIGNPTTITVGGSVNFTDQTTNNPTSWEWTFDGGTPATNTGQNPIITYNTPGTYTVVLKATNNAGNDTKTKTNYITVVDAGTLVADFTANQTTINIGGTVNFTDQSLGEITSWSWQFPGGNPATSTNQNPSVTYGTAGSYNVTLIVSDGENEDDEVKIGYITVTSNTGGLHAAFVASSYNIIAGDCINFNDQSNGNPNSWSWSFPGATTLNSTNQHPTNICYPNPGIYDVVLQIQSPNGQDTYICQECITVNPDPNRPVANFEADHRVIPVGGVVRYTNLSENGPFNQWAWEFNGGTPSVFNDSTPPLIAYLQVGTYDVTLRCRKTNNVQDIETKQNYITVIPKATTPPEANFTANYTVVQPSDPINFIDLSSGNPYQWTWEFEGADQETSNQKNPMGITYPVAGTYSVRLTVANNFGVDIMFKEMYITVTETDPCLDPPTVAFNATTRLIPAGESVQFFDLSAGLPTYHTWAFPGGTPSTSNEGSPTTPIRYTTPGIYDVSLTVSNSCGSSNIVKNNYIYVFSSPVNQYCDTITTIRQGEVVEPRVPTGEWGYIAGQNGLKIREYANLFEEHTFSEVAAVIVPVSKLKYDANDSFVRFFVADGNYPTPDSILGDKKVFLHEIINNQSNLIKFNPPISVNGPFYVGYRINYPDEDQDGFSDDMFVVGIAAPRPNIPAQNQLYMKKGSTWFTPNELFGFSSALPLKPIACLVDVDEIIAENDINIYPNPTNGLVSIKIKETYYSSLSFEIYDIMGRKVISEIYKNGIDEFTTDLSGYPEGLYIIRMKLGNLNLNKKILLTK